VTQDLKTLYASFDTYMVRLNADLEQAVAHLPRPKQEGFLVSRLDFAEFCRFWQRVCADPIELQRWVRRLRPGGYEEERATIRRGFSRSSAGERERVPTSFERRAA